MHTYNLLTVRHQVNVSAFRILDSIVVSIPACHAGDRVSIPRRGASSFFPIIL